MLTTISLFLALACCFSIPVACSALGSLPLVFMMGLSLMWMGAETCSPWYSYASVLILMGGLLVVFSMVSSVWTSSYKFNYWPLVTGLFASLFFLIFNKYGIFLDYESSVNFCNEKLFPEELFNSGSPWMFLILCIYLLLILLMLTPMMSSMSGPLRSMSKKKV